MILPSTDHPHKGLKQSTRQLQHILGSTCQLSNHVEEIQQEGLQNLKLPEVPSFSLNKTQRDNLFFL